LVVEDVVEGVGEGKPGSRWIKLRCWAGGGNRVKEERDEIAELGESGAIELLLL
jgi:hypothetical protein